MDAFDEESNLKLLYKETEFFFFKKMPGPFVCA